MSVALAWLQWPRPPVLDGERWFKVSLATALRGRVEAEGGSVEAWEQAVVRYVPYHPAGRLPERKVSNPVAAALPGQALPGEIALLEALAQREGVEARYRRMYEEDEGALEARLSDPAELGEAYDPAAVLGPGASWDALAAWGAGEDEGFRGAALRALEGPAPVRWALIEGRPGRLGGPSVLEALASVLPEDRVVRVPYERGAEALEAALQAEADAGRNLVLVGEEAGVPRLLERLVANLVVRERVLAVVSVGGVIGGRTDEGEGPLSPASREDWMGAWFAARHLETEVVRLTPYFSVQWLDRAVWPPGVEGLTLPASRFPEPDLQGATATTLEVVDLGVLPADPELPRELVARALVAVVAGWVVQRR